MSKIGNFGSAVTFETSDSKILNFNDFQRESSGRWVEHARIGKKPLKQFLGPAADKVTFTVTLDARHGVKPRKTIKTIRSCVSSGTPYKLVIGGSQVGSNKFVMTGLSETWDEIFNKGELVRATLKITLEEYPE